MGKFDILQRVARDMLKVRPELKPGDTVRIDYRIEEGGKTRVQVFEGVIISIKGSAIDKTFIVRKDSFGVGVERIFPFHSPHIESIKVLQHGRVRRAKLYYLRGLKGRQARLKPSEQVTTPRQDG